MPHIGALSPSSYGMDSLDDLYTKKTNVLSDCAHIHLLWAHIFYQAEHVRKRPPGHPPPSPPINDPPLLQKRMLLSEFSLHENPKALFYKFPFSSAMGACHSGLAIACAKAKTSPDFGVLLNLLWGTEWYQNTTG